MLHELVGCLALPMEVGCRALPMEVNTTLWATTGYCNTGILSVSQRANSCRHIQHLYRFGEGINFPQIAERSKKVDLIFRFWPFCFGTKNCSNYYIVEN